MEQAKPIKKSNVPPQATTQKGETKENVQPNELKLSSEAISFQNKKVKDLASMPELSEIQRNMPGCANPLQAPFNSPAVDRVRESTRRFRESLMYSVPGAVREQAVDTLNLLIRFDKSVTLSESRVLMDAVKIITSKGLPA